MTITATFNENYTGGGSSTKTETYGTSWSFNADPVRAGYNFLGWFDDPTSGTQITTSTTVSNTSNVTLYAHWERAGFNIYQQLNGTTEQITAIYSVKNGVVSQVNGVYKVENGVVIQI